MSQALYRKYRSKSLDSIVGQDHIITLLAKHIEHDTVAHAYLLTGPRGVGKTSIARIIAHAINGLDYDDTNHLDIIEIDAASNNGVEDVRDLREKVHIAPTSSAKKVYIIDEVHMLSRQAFNALLKTLEEPPEHAVFILATTDADKLPATILSRVQRYNFRSISHDDVVGHLKHIAKQEHILIDDAALELIARHGGGSFRDSIGLLDQLQHIAADTTITVGEVEDALGITSTDDIAQLIGGYQSQDIEAVAQKIGQLESSGVQASAVASQLIDQLRQTLPQRPGDVATLDRLLAVASSHYPYVKLLTALIQQTPLAAASHPKNTPAKNAPVASKPKNTTAPAEATQPEPIIRVMETTDFEWKKLLEVIEPDSPGLHSLLVKAGHAIEAGTLTIYAGSNFAAQRLKSQQKRADLTAALTTLGFSTLEIIISASQKPPEDSHAASVAAIMGGGEEVDLRE